jgi:hypothetical protein
VPKHHLLHEVDQSHTLPSWASVITFAQLGLFTFNVSYNLFIHYVFLPYLSTQIDHKMQEDSALFCSPICPMYLEMCHSINMLNKKAHLNVPGGQDEVRVSLYATGSQEGARAFFCIIISGRSANYKLGKVWCCLSIPH